MKSFIIILLNFATYSLVFSQGSLPPGSYTSTNKKAIKYFEESKKITSLVAANINIGNGSFSLDKTKFFFSICKNKLTIQL